MPRLKQAGEGGILPEGMSTSLDGEKGGGGVPRRCGPELRKAGSAPRVAVASSARRRASEESRPEP